MAGLLACSGTISAQALDTALLPLSSSAIEADARVLPVWSNASGRVEALLLLDPSEPSVSPNALDRLLTPSSPALGLGARVSLDDGSRLRTSLQVDADAGLALLCNGSVGLSSTIGSLAQHCLLAQLGTEDPLLSGIARGASLQAGWESPSRLVDLSFGLSWLESDPQPAALWSGASLATPGVADDLALNGFNTLGAWARQFDSRSLQLETLVSLGPQSRLLIGGNVDRTRLTSTLGMPVRFDSASLSFGMGYGPFTGQLTGRLIEVPGSSANWSGVDIGLSWRTPWRGELSVGARNVIGSGDSANWPLTELPPLEDPSARVPYVRYQQDL